MHERCFRLLYSPPRAQGKMFFCIHICPTAVPHVCAYMYVYTHVHFHIVFVAAVT